MDLNLLKTFARLAETGSFTQAAKLLGHPKSRVSRAISRLEAEMGAELVRRTTRQTNLTTTGERFYERIHLLLNRLDEEVKEISSSMQNYSGILKVTAPEDMAHTILADIVEKYSMQHPKVEIQTIITNNYLDLTKENIDIALRAGKLKDSSLMQRKLLDVSFILVASKKYLQNYGRPKLLPDLRNHRLMIFAAFGLKDFMGRKVNEADYDIFLKSDSFSMLLKLALNGKGITALPDFYCREYLDNGELVQVFSEWKGKKSNVHLLYPPSKNIAPRTRAFIDMALDTFRKN